MFQKSLLKKIFIVLIILASLAIQPFYTLAFPYQDNTKHCMKDNQISEDFLKDFNKYKHKVISAPIDLRPTSNEYLENLVNLGGDVLIGVDKEFLDKGPSTTAGIDWIHGDSKALRNNIMEIVSENNNANSTVILNTSSYIFGGLVGTRIPSHYMNNEVTEAISDIDLLTKKYNAPRYYVHIVVPRVIPETRGFDYKEKSYDYGLDYYYTKSIGGDLSKVKKIAFTSLLIEYGYIKTKMEMSNNLTLWQQEFLGFFEDKYINNAEEKFKFNGIPIAVLYEQIYSETSLLIKQIMERVKDNKIDEMVVSMDDYVIPAFIEKYKKEVWVDKEADGNVVKYSFGKKYITAAMNYQVELYDQDNLNDSINGTNRNINYIYGTDELPQMIYSRDLTRRKGFATDFEVNYNLDINPEVSRNHIGYYEATTTEKLINQRINYVTRKLRDRYDFGVKKSKYARKFILFVHNSDAKDLAGKNYLFNDEQAKAFADAVYAEYNNDNNVGVLDLLTNKVDWTLFTALASSEGNNINQLSCYSGFNTIGNSTGLGIAHAQVFGIIDFWGDFYLQLEKRAEAQSKILAQHLLEDAIYNTKIKAITSTNPNNNSYDYIKANVNSIINSTEAYDINNKPGGFYWVMDKFKNYEMRIDNVNYKWDNVTVNADLPLLRIFECIINTTFERENNQNIFWPPIRSHIE